MKTLLTILFIGVISVKGQTISLKGSAIAWGDRLAVNTIIICGCHKQIIYFDSLTSPHHCECCYEWFKQIGQKTVLIYSYKDLLEYYAKDSATVHAIQDHVNEIQREIDQLLKKARDCR